MTNHLLFKHFKLVTNDCFTVSTDYLIIVLGFNVLFMKIIVQKMYNFYHFCDSLLRKIQR